MKNLAIIPARGGSKRIPRKNIKPFLGRPIISYSIEAAVQSKLFDEVMVSTDDDEIAEIAVKYGAVVPFMRSGKNAGDFATTAEVILEVLKSYQELDKAFRLGCCIYPCAPFVTAEKLRESCLKLTEDDLDIVIPVVHFSYPIWRALRAENGLLKMIWPENEDKRSQDLPDTFHDAGQFYFFKIEELFKQKKLWMSTAGYIELLECEVQDIDTYMDWELAEIKYKTMRGRVNEAKHNYKNSRE
jgi:N-acylneuraminate cytidylyltransferase